MVYNQELTELSVKEFDKIIEHLEKCLVEAYSRMKMTTQPWTKHTGELYNRGYHNVYGYDFSSNLISIAKQNNSEIESHFFVAHEKIVKQIKKHCKKMELQLLLMKKLKKCFRH